MPVNKPEKINSIGTEANCKHISRQIFSKANSGRISLCTVITSNPARYVSDSKGLKLGEIIVNRNEDFIDTTQYEGVIKIPTLEVRERTLVCAYEILVDDITDKMLETLILSVLLQDYCDRYYEEQADKIDLLNLKSNVGWTIPYGSES